MRLRPLLSVGQATVDAAHIAHFVSLHALQALPLAGYFLSQPSVSERVANPVTWLWVFAIGYSLVSLLLFLHALAGQLHVSYMQVKIAIDEEPPLLTGERGGAILPGVRHGCPGVEPRRFGRRAPH